jgi:hypothetical protein
MKIQSEDILDKYNDAFRDVVTGKINRIPEEIENFNDHIKKVFKLDKKEDFNFLLTAMDIIEDTNMAFSHFFRFGLDGETRYEDAGEAYIRLYGILNATYIQQQAIFNLYRICHVPDLSVAKEKINQLNIRVARHKLGSHCNDFLNDNKKLESFVPIRVSLNRFTCEYFNNSDSSFHTINLKDAIVDHLVLMAEMYDQIYEKFVRMLYKPNPEKISILVKKIETLRLERKGHIIFEIDGGNTIALNIKKMCYKK